MKKEKIKKWLVRSILLVFVLWLLYLIGYKYIYLNFPSKISQELQKVITETAGKGYKVWYPGPEETNIESIYIDVDLDLLEDKSLFETCDKINAVIYDFVKAHPQNFELYPPIDRERKAELGFEVNYTDCKEKYLYGGTCVVFWFSNYLASKDKYDDGFSYMGAATRGVGGYGFQLSDFKSISGLKELLLSEIDVDDPEVLGELEELEYFYWCGDTKDGERLKEAAKKYGIEFSLC